MKKEISNRVLARLGNDYARVMGYRFVSDGIWETKTGRRFTTMFIGKMIGTCGFIADGNQLNLAEIRRVNKGVPVGNIITK